MVEGLQTWLPIGRDLVVTVAAGVTAIAAVAGLKAWKRELNGRERFQAAKKVVTCSHRLWKACSRLRIQVSPNEEPHLDHEQLPLFTPREQRVMSECEVYAKRLDVLAKASGEYDAALLEARVLLGSWVYEAFRPFGETVTESVNLVNEYLALISDDNRLVPRESPDVERLKERVALPLTSEDELSQRLAERREGGEKQLLRFLNRSTIRR